MCMCVGGGVGECGCEDAEASVCTYMNELTGLSKNLPGFFFLWPTNRNWIQDILKAKAFTETKRTTMKLLSQWSQVSLKCTTSQGLLTKMWFPPWAKTVSKRHSTKTNCYKDLYITLLVVEVNKVILWSNEHRQEMKVLDGCRFLSTCTGCK